VEFHKEELKENTPEDVSLMLSALKRPQSSRKSKSSHGVLVEGESGLMVRLARCCNPIPGDPITGYITRGRGVSVHRTDCPNVLMDTDLTRMIEVSWDVGLDKQYKVELEIVCNDRSGILANVLAVPTEMKINIHSINANPNRNTRTSTIFLGLDVASSTQVKQIITKLRRVKDVYSAVRKMGSNPNM
jgi:GTP pyrophosphokinase